MSPLDAELQTVDLLIRSRATTRLTDAFTLLYVKSEKQLRKLLVFIAYQSPDLQRLSGKEINATVASFKHLQGKHYINGINQIYHKSFGDVFGADFARINPEIERIRRTVRNKILHGQPTGLHLQEPELKHEIEMMREWITRVFTGFHSDMGFGGFERNTFRKAKAVSCRLNRTFASAAEFSGFLKSL